MIFHVTNVILVYGELDVFILDVRNTNVFVPSKRMMQRKMTLRDIVGLKEGMFTITPEAKLNAWPERNLHLVLTWIRFVKFRQINFSLSVSSNRQLGSFLP